MRSAVQCDDQLRVGQPVERQRPGQTDDMAAIDQPFAIGPRRPVKMHFCSVLPQPGGQHMFGLFDRHTVHMVDHLAHCIIRAAVRLARLGKIIAAEIQPGRDDQIGRGNAGGQCRHHGHGGGAGAPLADQNPAHET